MSEYSDCLNLAVGIGLTVTAAEPPSYGNQWRVDVRVGETTRTERFNPYANDAQALQVIEAAVARAVMISVGPGFVHISGLKGSVNSRHDNTSKGIRRAILHSLAEIFKNL